MKIEKDDERELIQILRGIAIILVVFHHVCYTCNISNSVEVVISIINRVHVMIFFVISGWLFEKNKIKYSEKGMAKFVKKKFVQLIIPYIFFSLSFSMIIWCGYHIPQLNKITDRIANGNIKNISQIVFDVIFYRNVYFESLWFLYAMFILMIIMFILRDDMFLKGYVVGFFLIVHIITKAYLWMFFDINSYIILDSILSYFIWIMLGRYFFKKFKNGFYIHKNVMVISAIMLLGCILRNYLVDLHDFMGLYTRALWMQIEIFIIRITFLIIAVAICKKLLIWNKYRIMKKIGDYSYDIYLVHNPWIVSTLSIIMSRWFEWYIVIILGTIMTLIFSVLISLTLKKICNPFYRICFGKWAITK